MSVNGLSNSMLPEFTGLEYLSTAVAHELAKRMGEPHPEENSSKHARTESPLAERVAHIEKQGAEILQGQQDIIKRLASLAPVAPSPSTVRLPSVSSSQPPVEDPLQTHSSFTKGMAKYHLSQSANNEDKVKHLTEGLTLFSEVDPAHRSFKYALFMQWVCKVLLCSLNEAEPEEKQKFFQEAFIYFSSIGYDTRARAAQYWKAGCQYYLAGVEKTSEIKQALYQQALEDFSKVALEEPDFSNILFWKGKCKLGLAALASKRTDLKKLQQDASAFFSKVDPGQSLFNQAQELMKSLK